MVKAAVVLIASMLIASSVAQGSSKSGNCPLSTSVSQCTPRCMSDWECSFNQKCCPNKCGGKSCTSPSAVNTGNDSRDKYRDVYCGGVKCRPYEKCQYDRTSKREKCVRT